jgi:hypothetical protein
MTDTEKIADVVVAAVRAATGPLLERIAALETRAPVPGPAGEKGEPGAPGVVGPRGDGGANGRDGDKGSDGAPGRDGTDGINGKDGTNGRDGVDGRDGQPGVPGVPGRDGVNGERGEKGADGAAGRDGTLEGVSIKAIDDRTFELQRADGSSLGRLVFPVPLYKGVYTAGAAYVKGDSVTYGGSLWIAREATTDKPGDGVTGWQLAVKAGREGREGKPGKDGTPGPKGEKGDPGRNYS